MAVWGRDVMMKGGETIVGMDCIREESILNEKAK